MLQVDNQDASFFRDRPERRHTGAVTEQALEALMDSGVVEPNSAPQELEAVELLQRLRRFFSTFILFFCYAFVTSHVSV